jgi:hypothetical protein
VPISRQPSSQRVPTRTARRARFALAVLGLVSAQLAQASGSRLVADGPISECYTVAVNPPAGSYHPAVTVCRPL